MSDPYDRGKWHEIHIKIPDDAAGALPRMGVGTPDDIGKIFGQEALVAATTLFDSLPDVWTFERRDGRSVWHHGMVRYEMWREPDQTLLVMDAVEKPWP